MLITRIKLVLIFVLPLLFPTLIVLVGHGNSSYIPLGRVLWEMIAVIVIGKTDMEWIVPVLHLVNYLSYAGIVWGLISLSEKIIQRTSSKKTIF